MSTRSGPPHRLPANESERLRILRECQLLDTPADPAFDGLAEVAAEVAGTPAATISLMDADRQWIKAGQGLGVQQLPRDISFCNHVVAENEALVVQDASRDERFADHPMVTGETGIRFYASFPLRSPNGLVLGTLCAMDRTPRALTPRQRHLLEVLAHQAEDQIELRRQQVLAGAQRSQLEVRNNFFELTLQLLCTANDKMYFVELNPAWEQTLGWTLEELRSRPFLEFTHPDDVASTIATAGKLLQDSATVVNFENRYRHKSGRWVPLSWVSSVKGGVFYAVAKDMTEYQRKASALAESEARLRATIDTAADAILTMDAQGTVEQANSSVGEIFGHAPAELVGRSVEMLLPASDRDLLLATLEDARQEAAPARRTGQEMSAVRKDGTIFPVEVAVSEIRLPDRSLFTVVIRDLSERKALERMQAEFVSTVSHELRTPLTSIHGALRLVAAGVTGPLPAEAKEYVDIAMSNSDRLVRLVNDVLDIEKMRSSGVEFRFTTVEMGAAVRDAVAANEAFVSSQRARLSLLSAPPPGEALADPDRLAQVLTNLISNAAKFSPPGQAVELEVLRVKDRFRVTVRDHGPGIPQEFRNKVFQPFAQADASSTREKGGTGLGLSITKTLVEKMRGTIGFEPAEGGGTRFYFELPYLPPVMERPEPGKDLVLVCEDDPHTARQIEATLAGAGYATHCAPTLERTRRLLALHRYTAVTLDLVLADGDGMPVINELRAADSTRMLPIVVVSGASGRLSNAAFLVSDIILKPFEEKRLVDAVNSAVARCRSAHPRLLHVEDSEDTRRIVQRMLPATWTVVGVDTLAAGRQALAESPFDLLLLDLALPDGNGEELIHLAGRAQVIIFSATEVSSETSRRVATALVKSRATSQDVCHHIVSLIANSQSSSRVGQG